MKPDDSRYNFWQQTWECISTGVWHHVHSEARYYIRNIAASFVDRMQKSTVFMYKKTKAIYIAWKIQVYSWFSHA